jgi:hypothetical protein
VKASANTAMIKITSPIETSSSMIVNPRRPPAFRFRLSANNQRAVVVEL